MFRHSSCTHVGSSGSKLPLNMHSMHESLSPVHMDIMEKEHSSACKREQNLGSITPPLANANECPRIIEEDIGNVASARFNIHNSCATQPSDTSCIFGSAMTNFVPTKGQAVYFDNLEQVQLKKRNVQFTQDQDLIRVSFLVIFLAGEDVTKLCIRDEVSSSLVASIPHLIKMYL
ncbi:hypothetical protein Tco_0565144 [Tanacetum coccineum]